MPKANVVLAVCIISCAQIVVSQSQLEFLSIDRMVDNVQEWISLGPRPIISIELESGSADLFVRFPTFLLKVETLPAGAASDRQLRGHSDRL